MYAIDRKIVNILKLNSNITYKELAEKIYLSEPSTKEQVSKLMESGGIVAFTI